MMPMHRAPFTLLLPAFLLGVAGIACAKGDQDLNLTVNATVMNDSNLFRLPDDANVPVLTGHDSTSERIAITSVGAGYKKSYSLQRFEADFSIVDYSYQNFSRLGFVAHNNNAAWLWSLTPRINGILSTTRRATLNSFSDYQNYNQSNQRTNVNTRFDGQCQIDGGWRALAGLSRSSQTNQLLLVAESDYSVNSADLGLQYAFASGSSITYRLKSARGSYLNRVLSSASAYDDHYSQLDSELRLRWLLDGKTSVDISATHPSRTHPNYPQRDYSGLNPGVGLNWGISAKISLNANLSREISSYQTSSSNYSQTDRLAITPAWQVSPNALLRLSLDATQRDYLGNPGIISATPQRSDSTRDASLSFEWQPYPFITLSAALQNAHRESNQAGLDYNSNMATLSAQYTY